MLSFMNRTCTLLLSATLIAASFTARAETPPDSGFHVSGDKLIGPSGKEFRIRGVNRVHWDTELANMDRTGGNTVRMAMDFRKPAPKLWAAVKKQILDNGMMPVVGNWAGTCKEDPAILSTIVDTWIAQADTWKKLNTIGIVNVANEWGPSTPVWRDSYITAISRMRAAGYTGTLMIDAGNCGQGVQAIVKYGAAVLDSDPLKNLIFDVHVYGSFHYPATASWMQDYATSMAALKATGLPIVLGEFGPLKVGPSQTQVPVDKLISDAEANGFGWMAWAMDDNDLPNCMTDDHWFGMIRDCWDRQHVGEDNFTNWGKTVVGYLRKLNVQQ